MTFTLDEVLDALSDAFPSPSTDRDWVTKKNLRDILSARPGHKEVSNESNRVVEVAQRRKT